MMWYMHYGKNQDRIHVNLIKIGVDYKMNLNNDYHVCLRFCNIHKVVKFATCSMFNILKFVGTSGVSFSMFLW